MRLNPRSRAVDRIELCGQLIMNAAFVAYETQKAKARKAWLEAGDNRRIIYVFDTDLVKTWCAPWRNGPIEPIILGGGYGQILPQQIIVNAEPDDRSDILRRERAQAEAVAWLLASRALDEAFSVGAPLLLAETHFTETMKVYQRVKLEAALHDDVATEKVNARLNFQVSSTLRAVRNNLNSDSDWAINARNAGAIIGSILRLIETRDATRTHGAVREWDSFNDIIRIGNGLFKLMEYRADKVAFGVQTADKWKSLCDAVAKGKGAAEIEALKAAILPIIKRAKSGFHVEGHEIDAAALAEVAYLNHCLKVESVDLRVVLMTGDRALTLALARETKHTFAGFDGTVSDFAFDHVRHLWSFVDQVQNGEDTSPKSKELFSGLLAFDDELESGADYLSFLLENAIEPDRAYVRRIGDAEIRDAYERWETYTKHASSTQKHYLFDELKYRSISKIILEKFSRLHLDVGAAQLLSIVKETTARARDRANVEFSGIGASSLLERHKNGIRNPPELMFDSLRNTDAIFKDLAKPKRIFLNADDFAARFDQISLDCYQPEKEDGSDDDFRQECYLKYLVLGALFASANRWIVAEQHAESAVRIVERARALNDPIRVKPTRNGEPGSHMSGREGYFLLASSKRVRAQSAAQFEEAQKALKAARACLREDRAKGTALGVPFIRFDSEALAIALARYYSARKHVSIKFSVDDPCNDLVDELYGFAKTLLEAREKMRLADDRADSLKGDRLADLPAGTSTSIATNLIQVYVISEFRRRKPYKEKSDPPIDRVVVSDAIDVIIEHTDILSRFGADSVLSKGAPFTHRASIICSPLMMLYAAVGDLLLGAERIPVFQHEADVTRIFDQANASVTHYDDWRFGELQKFTRRVVQESHT